MTRSIRFFFQVMPKVRGEWPEATAAHWEQTGLINYETDISHLLLLLSKPLKSLTVLYTLSPTCIYLEFYEFRVICGILTVYNLVHNHRSKDNLKQPNLTRSSFVSLHICSNKAFYVFIYVQQLHKNQYNQNTFGMKCHYNINAIFLQHRDISLTFGAPHTPKKNPGCAVKAC